MTSSTSWGFGEAGLSGMQVYHRVMRPGLFDPWAAFLVDTLNVGPSEAVLDVSCGPGTVAEMAARRVTDTGRVVGVDLSPAMLQIARAGRVPDNAALIEYIEGPGDALPLGDGEFDVVTCQQGLQFHPDRVASLREMRRVLGEGGRVGVATWTDIEESPPFAALAGALGEIDEELGTRYRGMPWSLTDPDELGGLLEQAGFVNVRVERHTLPWRLRGGVDAVVSMAAAGSVAPEVAAFDDRQRAALLDAVDRRVGTLLTDGDVVSHATSLVAIGHTLER